MLQIRAYLLLTCCLPTLHTPGTNICKCDSRGKQLNPAKGDWCWLIKRPCFLLSGKTMAWSWARCEQNGAPQVSCDGTTPPLSPGTPKPIALYLHPHSHARRLVHPWMSNQAFLFGEHTANRCWRSSKLLLFCSQPAIKQIKILHKSICLF